MQAMEHPEETPTKKKAARQSKRRRSTNEDGLRTPDVKPSTREVKSTTAKSKKPSSSRKKAASSRVGDKHDTNTTSMMEIEDTAPTTPKSSAKKRSPKKSAKKDTASAHLQEASQSSPKPKKKGTPKAEERKKRQRSEHSSTTAEEEGDTAATVADTSSSPPKPTLDAHVHRLRHLDYKPSPVLCMTSCASPDGNLALAREDGSCELYDVSSMTSEAKRMPRVYPIAKIAGSSLVVAHSLCWVTVGANDNSDESSSTPRQVCVAGGPDGTIWMVNFNQSQLQSRFSGGGGGVFDMVSCSGADMPIVATACQDGSVRLWRVGSDQIDTTPIATIPAVGAAVLSLAWGVVPAKDNRQDNNAGYYETAMFAGVADGSIRRYNVQLSDTKNGFWKVEKQTSVLRMTVESRGRRTATKIWTMQMLTDEHDDGDITLVTGNSLGQVQFWNAQTGTLQQSVTQTEYKADVLRIAVSADSTKVFASGVDSRVICLERMRGADRTWKWTTAQRPHTHDVKAMAIVPASDDEGVMETLVTSGVDTKISSYVVSDFAKRRPQIWYPWPSVSLISTAHEADVLSMQRRDRIDLFRLDGDATDGPKVASTPIGTVRIQTQSNIVASCLSPDAKWLALCNATALFVFSLTLEDGSIKPAKVDLPKGIAKLSVTALRFHGNELFIGDTSCKIHVLNLTNLTESTVLSIATKETGSLPIDSIQIGEGGHYMAALRRNRQNCIHVFTRRGTSYVPFWTVPGLAGSRPATMALINDSQLAVATPKSHLYIFDLAKQKLNPWSEANGFPIQAWPSDLNDRKDYPVRLASNPSDPTQVIMSSFGAFCVINTQEKMPEHCRIVPEVHVRRKRRKSDQEVNESSFTPLLEPKYFRKSTLPQRKYRKDDPTVRNCTMCLNYNSMLYLDFMGPGKMVVVEQPWLRVISSFPEPLQRRVYGVN
mmetsp:Transcript_6193/g.9316  ORF Transcript_6193/g.9316 Transcript_6193/m.9316 type:complete len:938 (-) Transcript_6193:384-3197(-)